MRKKILIILITALTLLVSQTYADMEKKIKEAKQENGLK